MAGPAPSSAPHVGTLLADRYELVRHLARGGMGDVYEGEDRLLERRVAVKVFRAAGPADRTRFESEVRVLAGLNHPGLVRVFDAGPHGDDAFVVLEIVDGPCLADALADRGPLSSEEAARLGADLADALAYIHAHGVVHRDVTPRNVLCDPDGRPRLVDFGIVRLLGSPRVTAASTAVGTPAYMAPEQLHGRDVTTAADVYSLGLLLLEALTGRPAFEGGAQDAVAARLSRDPDTTSGVPGAWRALLTEMTARAPDARPSASEVRDRLVALTTSADSPTGPQPVTAWGEATQPLAVTAGATAVLPVPPRPVREPAERAASPRRRLPWVLGAGIGAALLVATLAAAAGSPGDDDPDAVTTILPSTTVAQVAEPQSPSPSRPPTTTVPTTMAPTSTVPEVIPVEPPPEETPAPEQPVTTAPQAVSPDAPGSEPAAEDPAAAP